MARRGDGLRVRIARIKGETPKDVLKKPLWLPATLHGFGWTEEFAHTEYETVSSGQFSQPSMGPATARRLRTVDDIETFTMEWEPSWLVERGVDPAVVERELRQAGRARKPVELLASLDLGEKPLLRMDITIRSVQTQLREHEADTLYYTLRFSEWRNGTTLRKGAGGGTKLPTTHKLDANDSLYSLSEEYYGNAGGWDDIASENKIRRFGKKTALVKHKRFKVGSKIKIPKLAEVRAPEGGNVRG